MTFHQPNIDGEKINAGMNPLLFESEHLVRQVERDGEIWFVGVDICRALEIKNASDAIDRLDPDEKGVVTADTLGGPQDVNVVSEAGVYRLVFTSRKPVAERFKRWLAHEVIPSIRKTGAYGMKTGDGVPEAEETTENENLKLRHITECRQTFGSQAAAQLWFKMGLPVVPAMLQDPRQLSIFDYSAIKATPAN